MYRRRVLATVCVWAILGAVYWIGFAEARTVQAGTHTTSVGREATSAVVDLIDDRQEQPPEEWLTYENEKGGYSFSYPATFTVAEEILGYVKLIPSEAAQANSVLRFSYLAYEMDDADDDLGEWMDLYILHHQEPYELRVVTADLAHLHQEDSQQAVIESVGNSWGPLYGFLFTNGKLVLQLSTNSTDEVDKQLVNKIAKTVQFNENAPLDMQALYAPDEAPMISSVSDMIELNQESQIIADALQKRIDTGEPPADLLAQMSQRARYRYDLAIEANAHAIQAHDEQRVSPPTEGEYTEEDYQSYLKSEEDYANGTLVPTTPEDRDPLEEGAHVESGEFQQYLPGLFLESSPSKILFRSIDSVDAPSSGKFQKRGPMKVARIASLILHVLLCVSCNDTSPSPPPPAPTPPSPTEQSPPPTEQPSSPLPTGQTGDGEVLYQGPTTWGNEFQVCYDSDVWDYAEINTFREPVLYHRGIAGCRLNLREGARGWPEPDARGMVNLAGHEWSREIYGTASGGRYVLYYVEVDDLPFFFAAIHRDPLPTEQSDQCLEDAEAVLDTLQPR